MSERTSYISANYSEFLNPDRTLEQNWANDAGIVTRTSTRNVTQRTYRKYKARHEAGLPIKSNRQVLRQKETTATPLYPENLDY